MMNRVVIFDGNHLAYRAYYKFTNLKTIDGIRTGVIYGMPYIAESLIRRLGPNKAIMVFDGGKHESRIATWPDYKKRTQKLGFDREDFYRQKDMGMEIFMALGLRVAHRRWFEADDIIAQIARRYSQKGWEVVIVSADKDFHQLLKPLTDDRHGAIMMYNVSKGKMIDEYFLRTNLGYKPEQCVDYLCLRGDKSDNIPGYPGIGEKRALQFLEEFGSITEFLRCDDKFGNVDKVKLAEIYQRNKKLIDLKYFYRKFMMKEVIPWHNNNNMMMEGRLKQLCAEFEINSFLKPQFINTFKRLNDG